MHPEEQSFGQPRFQLLERVVDQVFPAFGAGQHQALARDDAGHLIEVEQPHLAAVTHRQAPQGLQPPAFCLAAQHAADRLFLARRQHLPVPDLAQHALDGLGQPVAAQRLQHVIERRQLERLDRMTVVGGDEDHGRRARSARAASRVTRRPAPCRRAAGAGGRSALLPPSRATRRAG